jgi:hypothetical protein
MAWTEDGRRKTKVGTVVRPPSPQTHQLTTDGLLDHIGYRLSAMFVLALLFGHIFGCNRHYGRPVWRHFVDLTVPTAEWRAQNAEHE